jgi:hypothetical protein
MASLVSRMDIHHEKMEAVIHSLTTWRKKTDGLPRNDGCMSGVLVAHLRENEIRVGASGGLQGICHNGNWESTE